jgi:hypothetical protein
VARVGRATTMDVLIIIDESILSIAIVATDANVAVYATIVLLELDDALNAIVTIALVGKITITSLPTTNDANASLTVATDAPTTILLKTVKTKIRDE